MLLETARIFGTRGVAARGLEEALRNEALKTRDDAREREFPAGARREAGERQTLQNRAVTPFDARDLKELLRPWRCVQVRGAGAF